MKDKKPIITTPEYWDCECLKDYIHPSEVSCCGRCGALRDDQPDARVDEVRKAGFRVDGNRA
jgi:hypothetical protein